MHRRSILGVLFDWLNYILLALIAASMVFPFYYMFVISFATLTDFLQSELLLWPKKWVLDSYGYMLSSKAFDLSLLVSVYMTLLGTCCVIAFTAAMGYGLTKKILLQKYIMGMVLFTFVFGAGLIPNFLIVKYTGLLNSIWSLIIPALIDGYTLIVFRQFFMNLPHELSDSALIDGASELQLFFKIILPLSKPILAAFFLFTAVDYWNSYFNAIMYLSNPHKWPVQVLLRQLVILDINIGSLREVNEAARIKNPPPPETVRYAAILITTLPILVVYPFLQKYFAKGVIIGAIKE